MHSWKSSILRKKLTLYYVILIQTDIVHLHDTTHTSSLYIFSKSNK